MKIQMNVHDWCEWSLVRGVNPEVIAYALSKPSDFEAGEYPERLDMLAEIYRSNIPLVQARQIAAVLVGENIAQDFYAFVNSIRSYFPMPDMDRAIFGASLISQRARDYVTISYLQSIICNQASQQRDAWDQYADEFLLLIGSFESRESRVYAIRLATRVLHLSFNPELPGFKALFSTS